LRFRYSTKENGNHEKKAAVYTHGEHKINFADVDSHAVYITERLQANGYETYIVGGAVRDLILGKKPKDFDIATEASPAQIKKVFRNARIIGRRFRLVHVFFGPEVFEISTFRSIKDGPTSNTFGVIDEDVLRRDFTLNSLFYDPQKQIVVDYVGGMEDIAKRVVRPIIALPHIFTDDPVRMIRAVKYAAVTGFRLPLSLRLRIRKDSALLAGISPSRLTEEIFKIIHSPKTLEIVEGLDSHGLYCYLQPRAAELFKTAPGFKARYFKTLAGLNGGNFGNTAGEALSALIRDYLEDNADWDGMRNPAPDEPRETEAPPVGGNGGSPEDGHDRSPPERCKDAFALARKFVLPMNPPRMELDAALRLLFAEHGVAIKKGRFLERRPRFRKTADAGAIAKAGAIAGDDKTGEAPNRRRRRRKKTGDPPSSR
jgi:poly(A) polymerase